MKWALELLFALASLAASMSMPQDEKQLVEFHARENLTFTIVVHYPPPEGKQADALFGVRGNGLGLSWDSTSAMTSAGDLGTWRLEVRFREAVGGLSCADCQGPARDVLLQPGEHLQLRVYLLSGPGEEIPMLGPVYRIRLPVSKTSEYFTVMPEFHFYPFFNALEGVTVNLTVSSSDSYIDTRTIALYMPPGYTENPKPIYDVVYLLDFVADVNLIFFGRVLDHIFIESVSDVAIIGFGDYKEEGQTFAGEDRMQLLTMTEGIYFTCLNGTQLDMCGGCLPPEALTNATAYFYWMTLGGCGRDVPVGGLLDRTLDFLVQEAFPAADQYTGGILSRQAEDTTIMGYSLGGLASCYAAWTRPQVFGRAACQSSSFWWPYVYDGESLPVSAYDFLNITLPAHVSDARPPQKILIDVGDLEQDEIHEMATAALNVFDFMAATPALKADVNLWYQVYVGQDHSFAAWFRRMWNAFKILQN